MISLFFRAFIAFVRAAGAWQERGEREGMTRILPRTQPTWAHDIPGELEVAPNKKMFKQIVVDKNRAEPY